MKLTTRPWHQDKTRIQVDVHIGTWRKRYLVPAAITARLGSEVERQAAAERYAKSKVQADYAKHLAKPASKADDAGAPTERTFDQLWTEYYADLGTRSANTRATYERCWRLHLQPLIGTKQVAKFRERDWDAVKLALVNSTCTKYGPSTSKDRKWQKKRKEKHAKEGHKLTTRTVKNILTVLSGMLQRAYRWGYISRTIDTATIQTPVRDAKLSRSEYYSSDEEQVLLACARDLDLTLYTFALLGLDLGLRVGEACALELGDIDWSAKKVYIDKAMVIDKGREIIGAPKHHSVGWVAMSDRLQRALRELQKIHKSGRVLRRVQLGSGGGEANVGAGITPAVAKRWMLVITARAHEIMPTIAIAQTTHKLRHTCASKIARLSGGDVTMVRDHLRHRDIQTSMTYIHSDHADATRELLADETDHLEPTVVPLRSVKDV